MGELFIALLEFYGKEFSPKNQGICPTLLHYNHLMSPIYDLPALNDSVPMVLLDPTNYRLSNVTYSADQVSVILRNFADLADYLGSLREKVRGGIIELPNLKTQIFCLGTQ